MLRKGIFKKPKNELEGNRKLKQKPIIPDEMCVACPSCKKMLLTSDLAEHFNVCFYCEYHFRMNARQRIDYIADKDTFIEVDSDMTSYNIIDFPNYDKKLKAAKLESAENEAVVCGFCKIGGYNTALFVMEPYFMMGSMGTVVGEKLTRLFEAATEKGLPVVGFTVSGGARIQEAILSLMQMAKVSGAVKKHSDGGNLYLTVLTDPTTGGVTASFAMLGDIIVAEPNALIGFAGPRVIEQTIHQKLPQGFQRAEFLLEKGFVDDIVHRKTQKKYITTVLKLHSKGGEQHECI